MVTYSVPLPRHRRNEALRSREMSQDLQRRGEFCEGRGERGRVVGDGGDEVGEGFGVEGQAFGGCVAEGCRFRISL